MSDTPEFEIMLTGGHPNSLGRTLEVVALIEASPHRMDEAYQCYQSADAVVRLRTSSIFKRLIRAEPSRYNEWAERLIDEVAAIDQASAQWTVAQIIGENLDLWDQHDDALKQRSLVMLFGLLDKSDDWIVTNAALKTLANIGCAAWMSRRSYVPSWNDIRMIAARAFQTRQGRSLRPWTQASRSSEWFQNPTSHKVMFARSHHTQANRLGLKPFGQNFCHQFTRHIFTYLTRANRRRNDEHQIAATGLFVFSHAGHQGVDTERLRRQFRPCQR